MQKERSLYLLIRAVALPLAWMPHSWLRALGRFLGPVLFFTMRKYRKQALSNLALASGLSLSSEKEIVGVALASFVNLAITILEYPRLARPRASAIVCENPEEARALHDKGQGIVFFCGHQANWEALFLDGTRRMKGIAIGKPIKNRRLYNWIVSIREQNGGKIIAPRNAVKEGLRALRQGTFVGIVGDQGMPSSGYSAPFLGRRAWTSTAPALLAYKTGAPILVATTRRVKGGYRIRYSDPIWPRTAEPMESEIGRLMGVSLQHLEESIKQAPGEWLWQHNRWKQQTAQVVYKRYRHDCLCAILPEERARFAAIVPHLPTLRRIYPTESLILLVPAAYQSELQIDAEVIGYERISEIRRRDYRFKLIFNCTPHDVAGHYRRLSAFEVIDWRETGDFSAFLIHTLCRPGTYREQD